MLSDEIRARLELLNRQSLPGMAIRLPVVQQSGFRPESAPDSRVLRAVPYLESGREIETPAGRYLSIVHPLSTFAAEIAEQADRVQSNWSRKDVDEDRLHPEVVRLGDAFPRDALLLDLETCGLGGAMIFLVGLIHATGAGLVLEQLLARDYAEERAILASLWQIAAGKRLLVTFNGKSFDWPVVHDRSTLHRLGRRDFHQAESAAATALLGPHEPRPELFHFDVLHHARRRWRHRLPNCRLQTLERYLCRRVRHDDVPGHEIPQAYHDFVRTGNKRQMDSILNHNALDLVTMAQVAMRMLAESSANDESSVPHEERSLVVSRRRSAG